MGCSPWIGLSVLGMVLCVLAIPAAYRYGDFLWMPAVFVALGVIWSVFIDCCGVPTSPEHRLLMAVASLPLPLVAVLGCGPFQTDIPLRAVDMLTAMTAVLLVSAGLAVVLRRRLTLAPKAAILLAAVAIPAGIYWQEGRLGIVGRDISGLFETRPVGHEFVWSPDGRAAVDFAAEASRNEHQAVLDLETMTTHVLPAHEGVQMVWDFAGGLVVRYGAKARSLYIYRLSDGQEVEVAKGVVVGLRRGRCVSPDGRWVCWLESAKPDGMPVIKTYDQQTGDIRAVHVDWPTGSNGFWYACGWSDDGRIDIQGASQPQQPSTGPQGPSAESPTPSTEPQPPSTQPWGAQATVSYLHILRVGFPQGPTETWTSREAFVWWSVSPDAAHAFAWPPDSRRRCTYYVDLRTGERVRLDGPEEFQWQRDGQAAYRVRSPGEGTWLYRFDVAQQREQAILRIPDGQELISLSPGGRFAIVSEYFDHMYPLLLTDIRTHQTHRLDVSMVPALSTSFGFGSRSFPWVSDWSNDERHFVLNRLDLATRTSKLYLYEVPDEWAPRPTADTAAAGR